MHTAQPNTNRPERRGFTLVELLIVMAIMAILIALAVGIGRWISEESARKRTQTAMKMVKAAISQYMEVYPQTEYPPDDNEYGSSSETLLRYLWKVEAARQTLQKIEPEIFRGHKDPLVDSWGKQMRYDRDGGAGGTGVIISAGPDGKFDDQEDNLRSDFD
jgi:prepilin-type N-terminal cleavage/methylation domain-containing protein